MKKRVQIRPGLFKLIEIPDDPPSRLIPCTHVGKSVSPPDGKPSSKKWTECDFPTHPLGPVVCPCKGCGKSCSGYGICTPDKITRIDNRKLVPSADSRWMNSSIFDWNGKRLMAYRTGWFGSRVHIAELGSNFQPVSNKTIQLRHPKCAGGQEDPRLFSFAGRLYLQFAGIVWAPGESLSCSVMLARMDDDLNPDKIFEPRYPKRTKVEKNWGHFDLDGKLWCVYTIGPTHKVLSVDPITGLTKDAYETPGPVPWSGGLLRGGSPPVRVGEVFYSWFHGWKRTGEFYTYSCGVYTFEAKPPFRPLKITPGPVWQPDPTLDHLNNPADRSVLFPAGAILDGHRWLVSAGHQDSFCEIAQFDAEEIDRMMIPVGGGR